MSDVSAIETLFGIIFQAVNAIESLAAQPAGGNPWFSYFAVGMSIAGQIAGNVGAFQKVLPEIKSLDAAGLDALAKNIQVSFPNLGNTKVQGIVSAVCAALIAYEPFLPVAPPAPAPAA
jgi:hypothetical protein